MTGIFHAALFVGAICLALFIGWVIVDNDHRDYTDEPEPTAADRVHAFTADRGIDTTDWDTEYARLCANGGER